MRLGNDGDETAEGLGVGTYIQKTIHLKKLRGKFSSVHPELKQEGIIRVEVGEEGLHFIRDTGEIQFDQIVHMPA